MQNEVPTNGKHASDRPRTIAQIKQEIDGLSVMQHEALGRATFLGMSKEEAKQLEERRAQISLLVEELVRAKTVEDVPSESPS